MYPPKKPFDPQTRVFIEVPAGIIGLAYENNPYWYLCEVTDAQGTTSKHLVEIQNINVQNDEVRAVSGNDGSVTLRSTRYSRAGRRALFDLLATQMAADGELPEADVLLLQAREAQRRLEQESEETTNGQSSIAAD